MTTLPNSHLAFEIPEDTYRLAIIGNVIGDNWADEEFMPYETLPPGQYSLVCLSNEVTEEIAGEIVDSWEVESMFGDLSKRYEDYESNRASFYHTAIESFASLLASLGITKRVAILKRNQ